METKIPKKLDTDAFNKAWLEWVQYRKESRKKLTPSTIRYQLKRLEKWGHDRAIAAIEETITQGWVGLREPGDASSKAAHATRIQAPPGEYDNVKIHRAD